MNETRKINPSLLSFVHTVCWGIKGKRLNFIVSFSLACGRIYIKNAQYSEQVCYRPGKFWVCKLMCTLSSSENLLTEAVMGLRIHDFDCTSKPTHSTTTHSRCFNSQTAAKSMSGRNTSHQITEKNLTY